MLLVNNDMAAFATIFCPIRVKMISIDALPSYFPTLYQANNNHSVMLLLVIARRVFTVHPNSVFKSP